MLARRGCSLLHLGENKKALNSYRAARELFVKVNDLLGQANSWVGESDVLDLMGESEKALAAIGKARRIFREVGSALGEGNAWLNEGKALFFTGDNQQALEA